MKKIDPSQILENTRRKLAQTITRKSAAKTDSSMRYTTATGTNEIFGRTYPAIVDVVEGQWCAYHREGGDWLIVGPIGAGLAIFETGTYSPTLDEIISSGTGAANTCRWRYTGAAGVGGRGTLFLNGNINLGSTGSMGTGPNITMPSGFEVDVTASTANNRFPSSVSLLAAGTGTAWFGLVQRNGVGTLAFTTQHGTDPPRSAGITPTNPDTWQANDAIFYNAEIPVIRV